MATPKRAAVPLKRRPAPAASVPDVSPAAASPADANARALARELDWFGRVLETRISLYFEQPTVHRDVREIEPPALDDDPSEYAAVVRQHGFGFDERLVLVLALVPHVRPQALDTLFIRNKNLDKGYTEFGGWRARAHSGFLPTCETAAFLVAGDDLPRRFALMRLFEPEHAFARHSVLRVEHETAGEPFFSGGLVLSPEYLSAFTTGRHQKPDYGIDFPAKLITSTLAWSDLVLGHEVLTEIDTILSWLRHAHVIMHDWGLGRWLKPGYRSLFYGPPGTGKTLTATLIGAEVGADVYRIDLSMVVSKFIGETEKNLARVFDQARNKQWILFFDEADALFGKRTQVSSSHDRYANQEVSYLLQRVEDHPGVVILATNIKANIDEAFARRFQSVVHFPMPDPEQRLRLWSDILGERSPRAADVDLSVLADRHELSGGAITNIVRHAAVRALQRGDAAITQADLVDGIAKERFKEGKTA